MTLGLVLQSKVVNFVKLQRRKYKVNPPNLVESQHFNYYFNTKALFVSLLSYMPFFELPFVFFSDSVVLLKICP